MISPIPDLALFALVAAFWRQFVGIIDRFRGLFVSRTTLRNGVSQAVSDYLLSQCRVIRWGDLLIESSSAWVRPKNRMQEVAYESPPGKPMVAIWNGRPVIFRRPLEGNGHSDSMPSHDHSLILIHFRGTLDIFEITRAALEWQSLRGTTGQRYRVKHIGGANHGRGGADTDARPSGVIESGRGELRPGLKFLHWTEEEVGPPKPKAPFDSYALGEVAAKARDDFRRWCGLKDWYLERGIPWRRGHLLYGPPGTGKTALVRALAQEADMPVFSFDLSSLDNDEFRHHWREMQESAPCIALIEDIDGVFHGRENVLSKSNSRRECLTFDCLLNAIGGIETADGVFVVVTTNRPEHLDDALGQPTPDGGTTRPGRLDRSFCLPSPNVEQRISIVRRICGRVDEEGLAVTREMSAAEVTEWAVSKALEELWMTNDNTLETKEEVPERHPEMAFR